MLSRILVPLDGSETAEKILDQIAPLVERTRSKLVLMSAIWTGDAAVMAGLVNDIIAEIDRDTKARLDGIVARLAARGFGVEVVTRLGPPATAILDAVKDQDISLVAMTTHGRTGLSRWLMGSVAERVVRVCPVPILVMRSFDADASGIPVAVTATGWKPHRILVPSDGMDSFNHIAPYVTAVAKLFGAKLDLLHVRLPPLDERPAAEGHMHFDVDAFTAEGIDVEQHIRHSDNVADSILASAAQLHSDLIAMPTHGYTGVARWVMGSVTEAVLRSSRIPVLVVRQGPHDLSEWTASAADLVGSGRYQIGTA